MVWQRFGDVKTYVEPFFGSGTVLLSRPTPFTGVETVNDKDALVSNFWRALQADPDAVAAHASWPVLEPDLHARHARLANERIMGGIAVSEGNEIAEVLAGTRPWWVAQGDCLDVLKGLPEGCVDAVVTDPPYSDEAGRDNNLYREEDLSIAHEVREWAVAHGENPRLRIALCGYDGEHAMPESWECVEGRSGGGHGYGGQGKGDYANARRERIWFSPHCIRPHEFGPLFS